MIEAFCVGLGGFVGALLRYWIGLAVEMWLSPAVYPVATFIVNVIGCFAIGVIGSMSSLPALTPNMRLLFIVGGLGSLTTFSSFGIETLRLRQDVGLAGAAANVLLQVVFGLLAVWLGVVVSRRLTGF